MAENAAGAKDQPNPDANADATAAAAAAAAAAGNKDGDGAGKETPAGEKPAGEVQDGTRTDGKPDGKQAAADTPKVPDTYTFTPPEGSPFDDADLKAFSAQAKAFGLTQEEFDGWMDAQHASLETQSTQLLAELRADPELGGAKFDETVAFVKKAREAMWPPGSKYEARMTKYFDKLGAGNDPAIASGLAMIGRQMSEDGGGSNKPGGGVEKTRAQRMYPNQV